MAVLIQKNTPILLIFGMALVFRCEAQRNKTIFIGAFFGANVSIDGGWSSLTVIPALEMALHHVNNDSTILKDYRLWYDWRDSKCESGAAIRALLDLVDKHPHKVAFIGPGCSLAARPVAEALRYWKSVQVGYSISSPIFTDNDKFPHVFRTAPSETLDNPARVSILKKFNWNKVALITQLLDIYVMTKESLLPLLAKENITLLTSEGFRNDPSPLIRLFKEKDARIIIALMYEDMFRKTMCEAYHKGFYGSHIVWFIVGWYSVDWLQHTDDVPCTPEQLKEASCNLIETAPLDLTISSKPIVFNMTAQHLFKEYESEVQKKNQTTNLYSSFTYDAVWSIARMLNNAIPLLAKHNKSLETLKYKDKEAVSIFIQLLHKIDFPGMSGRVTFDEYGDRQTVVKIAQNKGGNKRHIGFYDMRNGRLNISSPGFVWKDGRIPVAGTIRKERFYHESIALTVTFIFLASSGMIFCACCLAFNYFYRNHRYIKMSSPHFNNIIVIGCMLCYTDVLLATIHGSRLSRPHTLICMLRSWFLSTGFTFAFGGMFAKTYRVYKIFTNTELKKEIGSLGNHFLFFRLMVYWMGNAGVILAWQIADPVISKLDKIDTLPQCNFELLLAGIGTFLGIAYWIVLYSVPSNLKQHPHSFTSCKTICNGLVYNHKPDNEDFIYDVYTYKCYSLYYGQWVIGLLSYQGLLLLFGMFLAWETRNVEHPALNDSKSIALAVYNVFMFSTLAIFAEYFLKYSPMRHLLSRITVYVCSTSTICLLFVPKIYHFKHAGRVSNVTSFNTNQATTDEKQTKN